MPNEKVDYSAWNAIQSSRHQESVPFAWPSWTMPALLGLALMAIVALVIKVLMYQPSEHITLKATPIELAPIEVVLHVNHEGTMTESSPSAGGPASEDSAPTMSNPNTEPSTSTQTTTQTPSKTAPDSEEAPGPAQLKCPPISLPNLGQETECVAVRENGSITLVCGEHTVTDIPTLACVFDRIPKGAYRVKH